MSSNGSQKIKGGFRTSSLVHLAFVHDVKIVV